MKKIIILLSLLLTACNANVVKEEPIPTSDPSGCAIGTDKDCTVDENALYDELINSDTFNAITLKDLTSSIDNKETFVAYVGFKTCPWCQDALPYIKEQADLQGIKINYVNVRPDGDTKEFDLRVDTNEDYVKLQEQFKDIMSDETNKIYVPVVIAVKDGEIINYHYATVEDHDATEREMNEDEIKLLQETYKNLFESIK